MSQQLGLGGGAAPEIKWIDDPRLVRPHQLQALVNWASATPELVLDYEGDGVDARKGARSFMAGLYAPDKGAKVLEMRLLGDAGWDALTDAMGARTGVTIVHNGKHEVSQSRAHGLTIGGKLWDNQAASFALKENRGGEERKGHTETGHSQKALAETLLGRKPVMAATLHDYMVSHFGTYKMGHHLNPLELELPYNVEDITDCWDLYQHLKGEVARAGMTKLVETDSELCRVVAEMENRGVVLDCDRADAFAQQLARECGDIYRQVTALLGRPVDLGGRDMFGVFFGTLGVPLHKDIEKQGALDHDVLSWIQTLEHVDPKAKELARLTLEWRERDKLRGTYLLPWLYEHQIGGLLYPNLNTCIARTRRFTADSPNMQNIPSRTELGQAVKSMVCARAGWTTYSMDYSQVEYRGFVHYAGEPVLVRGYLTDPDFDIHVQVGKLLGLPRREAKHMNFGLLYGMGAEKLARKLLVSLERAKQLRRLYEDRIPTVKALKQKLEHMVKAKGYVQDVYGGRRHLNPDEGYKALNSICQMTAADAMRAAMVRSYPVIKRAGGFVLLQIHDDLQFELPGTDIAEHLPVLRDVKAALEANPEFRVPLTTECEAYQTNWAEKKKVKV